MRALAVALFALSVGACSGGSCSSDEAPGPTASAAPSAIPPTSSGPPDPSRARAAAAVREGGALAHGVAEAALYVADEDHRAVRRVPLPVRAGALGQAFEAPGAPAQVLPLDGRVLVTVRDPGLLMVLAPNAAGALEETARVELPEDAWGLAVTADERTAIVTSAWSHQVSAVDLTTAKKLWSVDVAREPRGVVVTKEGVAYVTHLVGASITRLEGVGAEPPRARSILLPPAPLRSPSGVTLGAALGYAAVLSPDASRLYVARHALGALGEDAWFGAATVDVLLTASGQPLSPRRHDRLPFLRADKAPTGSELIVPGKPLSPFTQPRALAYRKRTRTLLVASEGDDRVVELDAGGLDPTRSALRMYQVGAEYDPHLPVAASGGAPTGLALSEDERTAFVWCRSTYDLVSIELEDFPAAGAPGAASAAGPAPAEVVHVADDPLEDDGAAIGRRLFYNATDRITSGGLGCAGCHPEGRDDGHVWHEAKINTKDGTHVNFVGHAKNIAAEEGVRGVPRRTPMLAGRVGASGPYGWHAESPDLAARLRAGFALHRWGGMPPHQTANLDARAARLAPFLRKGLVPPAVPRRELDARELRGRELFSSEAVGCAKCHAPESEYTDRVAYPLAKLPPPAGFDDEEARAFKTPSLRFLSGRAPYLHDGRATSLDWLIDNNRDRMGRTEHLSAADRAALIAFLRTL